MNGINEAARQEMDVRTRRNNVLKSCVLSWTGTGLVCLIDAVLLVTDRRLCQEGFCFRGCARQNRPSFGLCEEVRESGKETVRSIP